ncbi:ArsR family transcriptional regulator [Halorientalis brevis]|uniref:ArsR family transcriptional regulator n=1 Tax=Halorientalis brevis TaxID=1126241 RepID=A0ABD6CJ07_9EURY|nr:winged helix-turn-helix domain-containing protein [Halorientalis brevis]
MTDNWDDISFVISSQYRVAVLRRLADGPATPSRIANDSDLGIAHISRALQGLQDRGLVELLVSEERRKGRVYGISDRGSEVWSRIVSEEMVDMGKPSE